MSPDVFRKLAALGLTHDQMAGVLEIFADDAEGRKAKARARVQKWREKRRPETQGNVTEHNVTQQSGLRAGVTRVEDNLLPKKITGKEEKEDRAPAALSPFSELLVVLDAERAQAVVDHRQRLRKPLTAHAAKLLAAKFAKVPDSNAAADAMIASGWQGFEPEWLESRTTRTATGPPGKPRNAGEAARLELKRMGVYPDATSTHNGHEDEGDGRPGFAGTGIARRIAIASG